MINDLARSTPSKTFNNSAKKRHNSNESRVSKKCQYDLDIDRSIYDIASSKQQIRSGELKRRIEEDLCRKISYSTFSAHIQAMLDKKELERDEKIIDRSKFVFYSVPTEIKKQAQLRIIRTDPKSQLFKRIFTNLFLNGMIEGSSYATGDLNDLLHEIGASRQDLIIDHVEDEFNEDTQGYVFGRGYIDYQIPVVTMIYYRSISQVRIVESTSYRQNTFYHFCKEYSVINFTVPGMSIDDFIAMYYCFRVKREDAEETFMMALKNGLIRPIMEFRGQTRYAFADDALRDLIFDLYSFHRLEDQFCYEKWNCVMPPTQEEQEGRAVFYSDKRSSERFFNRV